MKKVAIVTGASSGMGQELVKMIDQLFNNIDEIWIIARRRDYLENLRREINKNTVIICEDITDHGFADRFAKMLRQEKPNVKFLVNAAGYGIYGEFADNATEVESGMIDTNCTALTTITSIVLPYMQARSRIINFASSAAFMPQPQFAVYVATKAYVLSFSRGLNAELNPKGIYVTAVCPGPVATEFFTIAESGQSKKAWFKDMLMANAGEVAKQALEDSINRKEVSVYGKSMKAFRVMTKLLPHSMLIKIYVKISSKNN